MFFMTIYQDELFYQKLRDCCVKCFKFDVSFRKPIITYMVFTSYKYGQGEIKYRVRNRNYTAN